MDRRSPEAPLTQKAFSLDEISSEVTAKPKWDSLDMNFSMYGDFLMYYTPSPSCRFAVSRDFKEHVMTANQDLDTYFQDEAKRIFNEDREVRSCFTSLDQSFSLLKGVIQQPPSPITSKPPTWIEAERKARGIFLQRFGIEPQQISPDNSLQTTEWKRIQQRALLEDVVRQDPTSMFEEPKDMTISTRNAVFNALYNNLLALGISVELVTDEDGTRILEYHGEGISEARDDSYFVERILMTAILKEEGNFEKISSSPERRSTFVKTLLLGKLLSNANDMIGIYDYLDSLDPEDRIEGIESVLNGDYDHLIDPNEILSCISHHSSYTYIDASNEYIGNSELGRYLYGQMFLGKLPLSFGQIERLKRAINLTSPRPSRSPDTSPSSHSLPTVKENKPRTEFRTVQAELDALNQETFLVTGPADRLANIDSLVIPNNTSLPWTEIELPEENDEEDASVRVKPLISSKGSPLGLIDTTGGTLPGKIFALATPPDYEITNISVFADGEEIPQLDFLGLSNYKVYRNDRGEYVVSGKASKFPGNIEYEIKVKPVTERKGTSEIILSDDDTKRLDAVAHRITQIGGEFTRLGTQLLALNQNGSTSLTEIGQTIRGSFQYTLLGRDETLGRFSFNEGTLEYALTKIPLGYDRETGMLRVQCEHAAWVTRAILTEVFGKNSNTTTTIRTLVQPKSLKGDTMTMGALHADVEVKKGNEVNYIDTTPDEDSRVFLSEISSTRPMNHPFESPEFQKSQIITLVTNLDDLVLQNKITSKEREGLLQSAPSDIFTVNGRLAPHTKLYMVLGYLYRHPQLSQEAFTHCTNILNSIIDEGETLSKLPREERTRWENQIHHFYRLGQQGVKRYSLYNLKKIAEGAQSILLSQKET